VVDGPPRSGRQAGGLVEVVMVRRASFPRACHRPIAAGSPRHRLATKSGQPPTFPFFGFLMRSRGAAMRCKAMRCKMGKAYKGKR
jgi:hypothetical protein